MIALRNFAGFLLAVAVGFMAVAFASGIADGMCTAQSQLLVDPVGALLSRPQPASETCPRWPTMVETWLTVWLPLCAALFVTGALAAKFSATVSLTRCALAGAIPYSSLLLAGLLAGHDAYRFNLAQGYGPDPFDLSLGIIVTVMATVIGALLGLAGGLFMKRISKSRHGDELAQHPERLDEMLDPTDDA